MKALLVERHDHRYNRRDVFPSDKAAIILSFLEKTDLSYGDPANIAIELLDNDNLRIWTLTAEEFAKYEVIREIDIDDKILIKALAYKTARIEYERTKVEFKDQLSKEMITPHCDAYLFLDMGSVIL